MTQGRYFQADIKNAKMAAERLDSIYVSWAVKEENVINIKFCAENVKVRKTVAADT